MRASLHRSSLAPAVPAPPPCHGPGRPPPLACAAPRQHPQRLRPAAAAGATQPRRFAASGSLHRCEHSSHGERSVSSSPMLAVHFSEPTAPSPGFFSSPRFPRQCVRSAHVVLRRAKAHPRWSRAGNQPPRPSPHHPAAPASAPTARRCFRRPPRRAPPRTPAASVLHPRGEQFVCRRRDRLLRLTRCVAVASVQAPSTWCKLLALVVRVWFYFP